MVLKAFVTNFTVTGVDAHTRLSSIPPGLEIGILYTALSDRRNRYPPRSTIARMLDELRGRNVSLHVCGRIARQWLLDYQLSDITHGVQRIQVNGEVEPHHLEQLCDMYGDHEIITQHNCSSNPKLLDLVLTNHSVLVDASGGRGITPYAWERPCTYKRVGFAGGLGPDNILASVNQIEKISTTPAWLDMESSMRDENDWFNVNAAIELWHNLSAYIPSGSS